MKKKFVTNLFLLLALNLLVKPFWIFGIDRTVQNIVGAGDYGFFFSLFSFSILLNNLLDLGINNYNNRAIARNSRLLNPLLSDIVVLKLFLGILYFVVCGITALIIGYTARQFNLLFFLLFNQFIAYFILYFRSCLSGLYLFRTDSILSVVDRALMIILCALLLWGKIIPGPFRIEWFVYAQTVSYGITLMIVFILVYAQAEYFRPSLNFSRFLDVLRKSYPFALLALLMSFYSRIDSVMLERMLPDGKIQAGIYAQAFRILDAGTMYGFLFATLLLPIFSGMIKRREPPGSLVQLASCLLIIPVLILAVLCILYNEEIMDLLYREHIESSSAVFSVLMTGLIGMSVTYIFGTLLTANGNLRHLNIMALGAVIFNIALNLVLIPVFFAFGAALASMFTQFLTALAQFVLSMYIFRFRIRYDLIIRLSTFIILLVTTGWLLRERVPWITGFFLIASAGLLFSLVLKLIRPGDLFRLIQYE